MSNRTKYIDWPHARAGSLHRRHRRRAGRRDRRGQARVAPSLVVFGFFFFQAEDGIRDLTVTGVQTCALPICLTMTGTLVTLWPTMLRTRMDDRAERLARQSLPVFLTAQIGRASCRERV